jgi:hypothetical protein
MNARKLCNKTSKRKKLYLRVGKNTTDSVDEAKGELIWNITFCPTELTQITHAFTNQDRHKSHLVEVVPKNRRNTTKSCTATHVQTTTVHISSNSI